MRKVANIKKDELRKEQFETLVDVFFVVKKIADLEIFLNCFLTDSEKAFLGQRLNIMRMLAKNFSYKQIEEKLGASAVTISNAQRCLDKGGDSLQSIVLQYKFKPKSKVKNDGEIAPFIKPHYPGSIF